MGSEGVAFHGCPEALWEAFDPLNCVVEERNGTRLIEEQYSSSLMWFRLYIMCFMFYRYCMPIYRAA